MMLLVASEISLCFDLFKEKTHTLLAGKPGLGKSVTAVPREQDSDNSVCAKEIENTSLTCGSRSNRNSVSSENPTPWSLRS